MIPISWLVISVIYLVHAAIRFGGLWNPLFYPLSMVLLWPLPWLLCGNAGRRKMGFRAPVSAHWFMTGPAIALGVLVLSADTVWFLLGDSEINWVTQHARYLDAAVSNLPSDVNPFVVFAAATVPAMLFSPLGEEFLYRGFMLADFSKRWGNSVSMLIQASAFALVHLAHYGLDPFQPILVAFFIPSMFLAGLAFGWIRHKSGSVWVAVWSHSVFNLGMNGIVFLWY